MKKISSLVWRLNLIWGICFTCLTIFLSFAMQKNGRRDTPFTKEEYLQRGGTTFDYYAGYAFYTGSDPKDKSNYYNDNELPGILPSSFTRWIYIGLYAIVWLFGFFLLADVYRTFNPTGNNYDKANKPTGIHYSASVITTVISLYGIYYTYIYCTKFWME